MSEHLRTEYLGTEYLAMLEKAAAREREDAITDAALGAIHRVAHRWHFECPGCLSLVHHTDNERHARTCAPLRAWAGEQV